MRSAKLDKAVLNRHRARCRPPPTGKAYVLWLQHDGVMVPAGIMPEGPDNEVVLSGDAGHCQTAPPSASRTPATSRPSPADDVVASFPFDGA